MTRTQLNARPPQRTETSREGKAIMRRKFVFKALAVIGLLTLSATGAQAGSGGSPSPLTSFFVCKSINGAGPNLPGGVDVDSNNAAGWGFILNNVQIGNATLACAFAKLFPGGSAQQPGGHIACTPLNPPANCNEIPPDPQLSMTNLKCYSIQVGKGQLGSPPRYTTFDQLLGQDSNVAGSSLQYICAPAQFLQNLP